MEWVETTGKTIDEAKEAALDELGVDEQDAEVVVVEQERNGFLGIGRSEARVRARVRPSAPRPKRPQRGRRERGANRGSSSERGPAVHNGVAEDQQQPVPPGPRRRGANQAKSDKNGGIGTATPATAVAAGRRPAAENGGDVPELDGAAVDSSSASAEALSGAKRRRRRGGRGRGSGNGSGNADGAGRLARTSEEEEQMSVDQQAELAGSFVRGLVERFGLEATTEVEITEEQVAVAVTGEDLGLLVGPRGATLDAVQELTRTVVQRRGEEHGTRIVVDVAGFRARRAAALESFTRRVAGEVITSGTPEALEPMSAADRKIVHDVVNGIDGVETTSEGVDPRRYVVIRPTGAPVGAQGEDSDMDDLDDTAGD
jgi:spoIIIJ-associated protein